MSSNFRTDFLKNQKFSRREQIDYEDLLADLAKVDVIYLGERHVFVRQQWQQEI